MGNGKRECLELLVGGIQRGSALRHPGLQQLIQFNDVLMIRPEIGYYRNWNNPAFDLGTKQNLIMVGFDLTFRF